LKSLPNALSRRSNGLMRLLKYDADKGGKTHGTYVSAELVAALPPNEFKLLGPQIIALYTGQANAMGSDHWLWSSFALVGRLGDLGPAALPVLTSPNNNDIFYGHGWVEGLCRVGNAGQAAAEIALTKAWKRDPSGNSLFNLAIATRRIGMAPPPLSEFRQTNDGKVLSEAANVTPTSPASVCTLATDRMEAEEDEKRSDARAVFYQRTHKGK
jgi:hypothetical protein